MLIFLLNWLLDKNDKGLLEFSTYKGDALKCLVLYNSPKILNLTQAFEKENDIDIVFEIFFIKYKKQMTVDWLWGGVLYKWDLR